MKKIIASIITFCLIMLLTACGQSVPCEICGQEKSRYCSLLDASGTEWTVCDDCASQYGELLTEAGSIGDEAPYLRVDAGQDRGLSAVESGGRGMDINISSNTSWFIQVTDGQDWIATSCDHGTGDGTFYTIIAEHTDAEARIGWITITAIGCEPIRIKVTQGETPNTIGSNAKRIVSISAADGGTAVLYSDRTVGAAGNWYCFSGDDYASERIPGIAEAAGAWKNVKQVKATRNTVFAVHTDGTVSYVKSDACGIDLRDWHDIVQIDANDVYWNSTLIHVVGLCKDGTVVAAGDNQYGQCNVGTWRDIVQVACGMRHTVGLKSDGTVVTTGDPEICTDVFNSWKDITQIVADNEMTVGVKSDGTLRVAYKGKNCDDGNMNTSSVSHMKWYGTPTSEWTDIIDVSIAPDLIVGLRSDGTVLYYCGNATLCDRDGTKLHITEVIDMSEWGPVMDIEAGGYTVLGLGQNGTLSVAALPSCADEILALNQNANTASPEPVEAETVYEVYSEAGMTAAPAEDSSTLSELCMEENTAYWDGHKYRLIDESMSWTDAKSYCEAEGGHLVTITSAEEQTVIEQLLASGEKNVYWIGLKENSGDGQWVTGESFDYEHWAKGEPNKSGEQYGEIYRIDYSSNSFAFEWNDSTNTAGGSSFHSLSNHGLICEYEDGPHAIQNDSESASPYRLVIENDYFSRKTKCCILSMDDSWVNIYIQDMETGLLHAPSDFKTLKVKLSGKEYDSLLRIGDDMLRVVSGNKIGAAVLSLVDEETDTVMDEITVYVACLREDIWGNQFSSGTVTIDQMKELGNAKRWYGNNGVRLSNMVEVFNVASEYHNDKPSVFRDGYYLVSFDVYNQSPVTYGVRVYNADSQLVSETTQLINGYSANYSAWHIAFETIETGVEMLSKRELTIFSGETAFERKKTSIKIEVPIDGYFSFDEISTNEDVLMANFAEALISAIAFAKSYDAINLPEPTVNGVIDMGAFVTTCKMDPIIKANTKQIVEDLINGFLSGQIKGVAQVMNEHVMKKTEWCKRVLTAFSKSVLSAETFSSLASGFLDSAEDALMAKFYPAYAVFSSIDFLSRGTEFSILLGKMEQGLNGEQNDLLIDYVAVPAAAGG